MRARFAAALGSPIPTKQTVPFFNLRAAAIVMISAGVYPFSGMSHFHLRVDAAPVLSKIFCAQHVPVHPHPKLISFPRDSVPRLAKNIVALVVTVSIRRMSSAGHDRDAGNNPCRQDARVYGRV